MRRQSVWRASLLSAVLLPIFPLFLLWNAGAGESWAAAMLVADSSGPGSLSPQNGAAGMLGARPYYDVRLEKSGRRGLPDIALRYPSFGLEAVDSDIAQWAGHIASSFERDFATQEALGPAYTPPAGTESMDSWLNAGYTLLSPSDRVASLVFDVWMCTGDSSLSQDVLTLNYNLVTGQRLNLVDIFENVDAALSILSERSRAALARGVGRGRVDDVIASGTAPEPENFASLALTPAGVRVYFQPYQVTLFAGSQKVDIALEDLMPAGPLLALWGRNDR
ncbi:MAG: RsiV family protein [Desulfovibrionaceae bacterium]|nr:RsiV family protein [Desulfovibrionaceae bacterium]